MAKRSSKSTLNRREFLRRAAALGGAAALASALEGCSIVDFEQGTPPTSTSVLQTRTFTPESLQPTSEETSQPAETQAVPSATPTEVEEEGIAKMAFVKTNDRAEGVRKALALLAINPVAGKRVFLKPNFNSSDPTPGSTHMDTLAAFVAALKEMGAQSITVGDRSGMGETRRVMEQLGVFRLAEELDFDVIVFDELAAADWVMVEPTNSHWEQGFPMARPALEAEALVQTCCLKTHRYGGHFTMSLKNSVGLVGSRIPQMNHNFMSELHSSARQRSMIAEINAAYSPALIVVDGVEAFISGGPDVGERVSPGVVIAGTDRIAIDAVGVALLRYFGCQTEAGQGRIFEQEQIARAVELKLGIDHPQKIKFLTGDADSAAYSEEIKAILAAG